MGNDYIEERKVLIETGTKYAEIAIRSLILISGGAAVALSAFAGAALQSPQRAWFCLPCPRRFGGSRSRRLDQSLQQRWPICLR